MQLLSRNNFQLTDEIKLIVITWKHKISSNLFCFHLFQLFCGDDDEWMRLWWMRFPVMEVCFRRDLQWWKFATWLLLFPTWFASGGECRFQRECGLLPVVNVVSDVNAVMVNVVSERFPVVEVCFRRDLRWWNSGRLQWCVLFCLVCLHGEAIPLGCRKQCNSIGLGA